MKIPVIVKIGRYFTNLPAFVSKLKAYGADAVTIFNRFYEPDIDIETMQMGAAPVFSSEAELRTTLRWTGILCGKDPKLALCPSTGVHSGASAVKLLLMAADGKIEKIVSKEYPLYFPHPGWSEQKPEDWWDAVVEGLKELTADCEKSRVAGISFGGQMHGLVVLDARDQVIRPAILWNDGRTGKETDYLNGVIGKEKLSEYTANIAFAGFTAPKILWMKEKEPENFAKIVKIMLPKDYLAYRMSGVHCTDYSDASGMLLLNVQNRCWSKEMMEICGITEAQLPKLFESYEAVGTVKEELAKELGLPEQVKVIAGAGDMRCSRRNGNRGRRDVQHFPGNLRDHLYFQQILRSGCPQCAPFFRPCRRTLSPDGLYAVRCLLQQVVVRGHFGYQRLPNRAKAHRQG